MAIFERDPRIPVRLPTVDRDGNPITEQNPLTLEDVVVRIIESTDPVLGLRSTVTLDPDDADASATSSPVLWTLLGFYLRDIFLDGRIDALEALIANLDLTVNDASITVKGIIEIATLAEAQVFTDNERAITAYLLGQILRGSAGAASTTRRGTSERANDSEAVAGSDTERYVTPRGLRAFVRGTIAAASTTFRGAVERLTNAEGRLGTDTTRYPSIATILDALRNGLPFRATSGQYGVVELADSLTVTAPENANKALTPASMNLREENLVVNIGSLTREGSWQSGSGAIRINSVSGLPMTLKLRKLLSLDLGLSPFAITLVFNCTITSASQTQTSLTEGFIVFPIRSDLLRGHTINVSDSHSIFRSEANLDGEFF